MISLILQTIIDSVTKIKEIYDNFVKEMEDKIEEITGEQKRKLIMKE